MKRRAFSGVLLLVLGLMGVGIFYSVASSIRDVAEGATNARHFRGGTPWPGSSLSCSG